MPRVRTYGLRIGVVVVVVCALVSAVAFGAGGTPKRLTWSTPATLAGAPLEAVSCPSEQLCVAGADSGLEVSTGPFQDPGSWKAIQGAQVWGVSCPSSALCVAVTDHAVLVSNDPVTPASWHSAGLTVTGGHLGGVSCASATLCVAYVFPTRNFGNGTHGPHGGTIFSSSSPAGGTGAWKKVSIRDVPSAVSCIKPNLCVLGTLDGDIMTSSHPLKGKRSWRITHQGGAPGAEWPFFSVACATTRYCLATETPSGGPILRGAFREKPGVTKGYLPSSWVPTDVRRAKAGTWLPTFLSHSSNQPDFGASSCTPTGLCAAAGEITDSSGRNGTDFVYVATKPAGWFTNGFKSWAATQIAGSHLTGVSCPDAHLCVVVGMTPRQFGPGGPGNQPDGRIAVGRG